MGWPEETGGARGSALVASITNSRPPPPRPIQGQPWPKEDIQERVTSGDSAVDGYNVSQAIRAIPSPHSCRKCPPSAISSGGGQLRILACNARITGGPSTGSFMPTAI